jgi:D-glycero-D-manno-heptose 1,7-bisphosphate phosphatase
MRPAVFLDRDGTMIREVQFLRRPEDVHWLPATIDAVRMLKRAGFLVCVATNQSGVGRGLYSEDDVRRIHEVMAGVLDTAEASIDAWYFCPHHPDAALPAFRQVCDCRKPKAGMARQAAGTFDVDLDRSFVVGDRLTDIALATGVGARGILVRTGYGEHTLSEHAGEAPGAAVVAHDLMEATAWILRESGHPKEDVCR